MKHINQLRETMRTRRESLGLTQRSLARRLGVEASYVAFIESGRRKPSLKLVGRMADILGLDRQNLLVLTHPEAKELIAEEEPGKWPKASPSWQRFTENQQLLARHNVTRRELRALESLSLLGTVHSAKDFVATLTLIRDVPSIR